MALHINYTVSITLQNNDADLTGFENDNDLIKSMIQERIPNYMHANVERATKDWEIEAQLRFQRKYPTK